LDERKPAAAVPLRHPAKPALKRFDYRAKADVFVGRSMMSRRKPLEYRSFRCASDAIRFVMEELPPERLGGVCMEIDDNRFDAKGIRGLYQSEAYPLDRAQEPSSAESRARP
jgi:hypothetical protein